MWCRGPQISFRRELKAYSAAGAASAEEEVSAEAASAVEAAASEGAEAAHVKFPRENKL